MTRHDESSSSCNSELHGANMKHNLEVMFDTLYDRARALKSRLLRMANFRSGGELSGQSRPNPLQLKYPLLGETGKYLTPLVRLVLPNGVRSTWHPSPRGLGRFGTLPLKEDSLTAGG